MLTDHLGKTMKVYIDDMLVKSLRADDHLKHLEEAFNVLRRYRMKRNHYRISLHGLNLLLASRFVTIHRS